MNLLSLIAGLKVTLVIPVFLAVLICLIYLKIKFFRIKIHFLEDEPFKGHVKTTDLSGIIHFHSVYSDGSGRMEDLIKIAKKLKADFLISSDHNTLKPKLDGLDGYYGKLLYFAGEEINTEFGHFLAIGLNNEIKKGNYKDVLSNVKRQNAAGFISHPHNWWVPWKNFNVKGYDGIEIINLDSQWRGMNPLYIILVLATYKINSFYSLHFLTHKPKKTIKFWDGVQKHSAVITGIAAIDAHSNVKISEKFRLKFPKYEELFSVARTHVLLDKKLSGDPVQDEKAITKAVKRASCYFSFDIFGKPEGFYFEAGYCGEFYLSGSKINMGQLENVPVLHIGHADYAGKDNKRRNRVFLENQMSLEVEKPDIYLYCGINIDPKKTSYKISLFRDGIKIFAVKNGHLAYKIKEDESRKSRKGSSFYRTEIDIYSGFKRFTYLYSNNIEIFFK